MSAFKACDIRGVFGREVTPGLAYRLGLAVGGRLPEKRILIGGDVRLSTPLLKGELIRGLLEAGCRITDIGGVPTPAFYFAKRKLGIPAGIMVTASHNPAEHNGFKVTLGNMPITVDEIKALEEDVASGRFEFRPGGAVAEAGVIPDYTSFLEEKVHECRARFGYRSEGQNPATLTVVVDCGNGCYSRIAPRVFRSMGFRVIELFCEEDGAFPNREPNPAVSANLAALCSRVREEGADFGAAFDGDGDRVAFVGHNGAIIENDGMIALISREILRGYPGAKVVYDIKCSGLIPDEVRKAGGIPVMEKSGHAFIKTSLIREKAAFAGEISGHYFFDLLGGDDDGLFAGLLVGEMIRASGSALEDLAGSLPRRHITPDIRIPYHDGDKEELLGVLARSLANEPDCSLSLIDGVRGEFEDGWGLVRPSVTEPLLTLRFEAKTMEGLSAVKDRFLKSVPKIRGLVDGAWVGIRGRG